MKDQALIISLGWARKKERGRALDTAGDDGRGGTCTSGRMAVMPELEEAGISAEPQFGFKLYVSQGSLLGYIRRSLKGRWKYTIINVLFFFFNMSIQTPASRIVLSNTTDW